MAKRAAAAVLAAFSLVGCEAITGGSYDVGYKDGYAVGYNTACEIRSTMVNGDWHHREYSRGYADGVTAGIIACNNDRRLR